MGLVTPWNVGLSQIRNWTCVCCIGKWILYHWAQHLVIFRASLHLSAWFSKPPGESGEINHCCHLVEKEGWVTCPKISLRELSSRLLASTEPDTGLGPTVFHDILLLSEDQLLERSWKQGILPEFWPIPGFLWSSTASLLSASWKGMQPWTQGGVTSKGPWPSP